MNPVDNAGRNGPILHDSPDLTVADDLTRDVAAVRRIIDRDFAAALVRVAGWDLPPVYVRGGGEACQFVELYRGTEIVDTYLDPAHEEDETDGD